MLITNLSVDPEVSTYRKYVQQCCERIDLKFLIQLEIAISNTNWDEPETAVDFNNIAVMSLIEADNSEDLSERLLYLEYALEALYQGVELPDNSLCKAHLAVIYSLLGEHERAMLDAYNSFFETLQYESISQPKSSSPLGLIYLPRCPQRWQTTCQENLTKILQLDNGNLQALTLMIDVICQSRLNFYHPDALRFLHLAIQFSPTSPAFYFQLGIAGLHNQLIESLAYLHLSRNLSFAHNSSQNLQALYLAYRDLHELSTSEEWRNIALNSSQVNLQSIEWAWTKLSTDTLYTYVPFENDLLLAIEPSFRSISTCVLVAQGDWFEAEMEMWRDQIQTGMTVIDVGANIGVYTFSAAKRVGNLGKVIAIEPFFGCVQCLEKTCHLNQLDWVTIIAGAASDRNTEGKLLLHSASELNELEYSDKSISIDDNLQLVDCFKLDSLIEQENLSRLDWLKIDAEGFEMQVLLGCDRILKEFRPNILYENSIDNPDKNIEVAEYLMIRGYELFRYQPYLKQLIPIDSENKFIGNLNLIALFQPKP